MKRRKLMKLTGILGFFGLSGLIPKSEAKAITSKSLTIERITGAGADDTRDLILGDLTVVDDGDLGLSIYNRIRGEKACYINLRGELSLARWIMEKRSSPVGVEIPDHEKLQSPANHPLPELFRALKWGRPGKEQMYLLELADSIEYKDYNGF